MIYLDNHATTRCDPAVLDAMWPWFAERYGNAASRSHRLGVEARAAVEGARGQLAGWLGASPKEIVFTSGATESDNLAILGAVRASERGRHVVTLATEHKAVLDPAARVDATMLGVGSDGLVDPADVVAALRPDTVLVSVMLVNNEIGVIQPVAEIAAACRERGVLVHCDAAQAGFVPVDVGALGVDLLSISGHKIHGPKGIGALYVRRGRPRVRLEPLLYGGGHERGLRSGTLPVPLIVGLGEAAARLDPAGEGERVRALRDALLDGLRANIDGLVVNGSLAQRTPNNLNVSIPGVEAEALLMGLRDSVALSTGSACSSETLEPSHVLRALGLDRDLAHASVRFGLSRFTTMDEIARAVALVSAKVAELRAMGDLYER